jgi:hypothetical protein
MIMMMTVMVAVMVAARENGYESANDIGGFADLAGECSPP